VGTIAPCEIEVDKAKREREVDVTGAGDSFVESFEFRSRTRGVDTGGDGVESQRFGELQVRFK
jgi:hypothetical protein